MPYSPAGVHELQNAPNVWLKKLNPQVMVHSGTLESPKVINENRARGMELAALLPGTVIGMRWWPDDNILLKMSDEYFAGKPRPVNWWTDKETCDTIAGMYADRFFPLHVPGTILMVGNEDDPNNFACTVALHTAVARQGTTRRVPLGLCCTSMGNPRPDQYPLLKTLFAEMERGRSAGVIHWWRPNTYSPVPTDSNLVQQHIREAKKLGNFPPTFYGEFNFIRSVSEADKGPLYFGMAPYTWRTALEDADIPVPYALYCWGDGIYGSQWKWFNLLSFADEMLLIPKSPFTAYQQWKLDNVPVLVPPQNPKSYGLGTMVLDGVRLRYAPTTTGTVVVRTMKLGDKVTAYQPNPPQIVNGYNWLYGEHSSGDKGWFADTIEQKNSWKPDVVDPTSVLIDMVFISQLGNANNNDCGQANATSAALTLLRNQKIEMPMMTLANVLKLMALPDKPTSVAQLKAIFAYVGVPAFYDNDYFPSVIRESVGHGYPVCVLINYVAFDPTKRFGHWAMVVGLTEGGKFILNDPYNMGALFVMDEATLTKGLTDQKNADGTSFASIPYQGFSIKVF